MDAIQKKYSSKTYSETIRDAYSGLRPRYLVNATIDVAKPGSDLVGPGRDGAMRRGFLVTRTPDPGEVRVVAAILPTQDLSRSKNPIAVDDAPWFVGYEGSNEEFKRLREAIPEQLVEVSGPRLSKGQVQFLVVMFGLVVAASAVVIGLYSDKRGPVADFLAYVLPSLAAVVVAANLYLQKKIDDLATYEASLLLLFIGMICNAYVHPCGPAVVTIMCLGATFAFLIILSWRVLVNRREDMGFYAFLAGFSPWFLACVAIAALAATLIFWQDFFISNAGHLVCLPING